MGEAVGVRGALQAGSQGLVGDLSAAVGLVWGGRAGDVDSGGHSSGCVCVSVCVSECRSAGYVWVWGGGVGGVGRGCRYLSLLVFMCVCVWEVKKKKKKGGREGGVTPT